MQLNSIGKFNFAYTVIVFGQLPAIMPNVISIDEQLMLHYVAVE